LRVKKRSANLLQYRLYNATYSSCYSSVTHESQRHLSICCSFSVHFLSLFPTVVTHTAWLHTVQQKPMNMHNEQRVCGAFSWPPAIQMPN